KASHVMLGDDGAIRGCDHGLTFHPEPKLRTVIWELGGMPIPSEQKADLARLAAAVADRSDPVTSRLLALLDPAEVEALGERAEILRSLRRLPDVEPQLRPYP